ncbi:TonB-dependent receptor [Tardiphaga sp.]|uniref:TonB-dependent receptor n=1 Tax=Tardiphaga sp. TaxID=1926292 RepID=UPI00352BBE25
MREIAKGATTLGGSLVLALSLVHPAFAQAGDGDQIVVTAAKRTENMQSVPISVSAIGGDMLTKARITSVDSLVTKVANLQLSAVVGENTPIFSLRGVSMSDYSLNQSSPVATYYDEVYKGNFAFLGVAMYDLERVEVLRGPQGTLYGKNTTGGAVNIISREAKLGETSGYLNLTYGNYDRVEANGAVNLPLGDKAALRVAGTFARAHGWFENVAPGMPDLASTREYAFRGTLRAEPTDGLTFVLRASTSFQNPQNYGVYAQPIAINRPDLSTRQIASDVPDRRRARTTSVAWTISLDLSDSFALTSITSYDSGSLYFKEDTDGTAAKTLEIPYYDKASQFAQDLRLTSNTGGPFDFILGAYFNREKVYNRTSFEIGTDVDVNGDGVVDAQDCADGLPVACKTQNQFTQIKKSLALYSDLKYKLSDAVTLRGGLRYTHDSGSQNDFISQALGVDDSLVATLIPLTDLQFKKNNISGKIGIDYKLADGNLIYASYSRGYRAPSFNAQAFFDPSELSVAKAEQVASYEVGVKTQFWDRRITLNAAGFYYDYKNQQFINIDPGSGAQTLLNIPKSRIYGGEAELTVRPLPMLTWRAGMGLLATRIREGSLSGVNVAGNRLSNAPTLTLNSGIDWTLAEGRLGAFSLHPEVTYQSSQYFEVLNISRLRQSGYVLINGHLDWESPNGRLTASLWAKNLTSKVYFTSRVDLLAGFGLDYNHLGNPRTYGITLGAKF